MVQKSYSQLPLGVLTFQERRECLLKSIEKLDPESRQQIISMAEGMVTKIKAKHPGVQFTKENAIEVLAMTGIFFYRRMEK